MLKDLVKNLEKESSKKVRESSKKFFKDSYTDKNDKFIGISMPKLRKICSEHKDLSFQEIQKLLNSNIHEFRMAGGLILIYKYKENPEKVFEFYLKNTKKFYNWDLVDITSSKIVGNFLIENKKERRVLYELIKSKNLWERRIAMVSTFELIKNNLFGDTLKLAEILIKDSHDLSHKATGWMLREIGKRDEKILLDFLKTNYKILPRTTLRYSIERFPEGKRKQFLRGNFK